MQVEQDYYQVLGVSPNADEQEIRNAYRQLARRYHPDVSAEAVAEEHFIEIQQAYEVLGDAERRKAYDRWREVRGLDHSSSLRLEITPSLRILPSIAEEQMLYCHVEILPAKKLQIKRLPLNICLVLDCSTSMKGEKLEQLKEATHQLLDLLREEDSFSLVTFSDRARVVLSGYRGASKGRTPSVIAGLASQGGTEICQGLQAGLEQVRLQRFGRSIDQVILLTDGQTYGDEGLCLELAEEAGRQQIGVAALGIGTDWNDSLLDEIARRSGGASAFIEPPQQIAAVFREKVQGIRAIFAQQVRLVLHHVNGLRLKDAFRVFPYIERLREEGGYLAIGDLEVETPAALLLEWLVDQQPPGFHRLCSLAVEGDIPGLERKGEQAERHLELRFAEGALEEKSPVPEIIMNTLEQVTAFRLQEKAREDIAVGRTQEASQRLHDLATRLLSLGQKELARAALLEAARISQTGQFSEEGKKRLKYSTRRLPRLPERQAA